MMIRPLAGVKAAILIANGFCQDDMVAAQKALGEAGANVRIISSENGLVNGWAGDTWGHHFAVDAPLGAALGADYQILVVPGGARSIDKLKLTAHTRRFIGSFMAAGKPAILMGDALQILILTENAQGRTVSGPDSLRDAAEQAGAYWAGEDICIDGQLVSGVCDADTRAAFVAEAMSHLLEDGARADRAA